ncbi:NepR family anti-sigma factor [Microvirga pakistanensis]|uniref:NepR family anti-sigma factor n=1 Tax=Microvirga pakistanensis TaxID=1682650 RepID=UPI001069C259|nr:NepR family anti-sigma factor [Microvirga pakistanensis]
MLTTLPHLVEQVPDTFQEPQAATGKFLHEPTLPPQVAACLGERLRAHYAQLMSDPVPDALLRILEPLDQKGRLSHGH